MTTTTSTPATNSDRLPNGTRVMVRHDQGTEAGTVIGSINPVGNEVQVYTVQFDDSTISTWGATRVTTV